MIETFSRDEFKAERFDYRPGEHVTVLGPTGSGKTQLSYDLLGETATEDHPAVVLVMKPRDKTAVEFMKTHKYKKIKSWPPSPVAKYTKPAGYMLWPEHTFNPDHDDENHREIFKLAIMDCYKKGNRIIFADEVYSLVNDLKMRRELESVWGKGRSMECGLWAASQRAAYIPQHAYGGVHHVFLFRDPDKRARQRYGEISGVNPRMIDEIVLSLDKYQCLYIKQEGPRICIVDGK